MGNTLQKLQELKKEGEGDESSSLVDSSSLVSNSTLSTAPFNNGDDVESLKDEIILTDEQSIDTFTSVYTTVPAPPSFTEMSTVCAIPKAQSEAVVNELEVRSSSPCLENDVIKM